MGVYEQTQTTYVRCGFVIAVLWRSVVKAYIHKGSGSHRALKNSNIWPFDKCGGVTVGNILHLSRWNLNLLVAGSL